MISIIIVNCHFSAPKSCIGKLWITEEFCVAAASCPLECNASSAVPASVGDVQEHDLVVHTQMVCDAAFWIHVWKIVNIWIYTHNLCEYMHLDKYVLTFTKYPKWRDTAATDLNLRCLGFGLNMDPVFPKRLDVRMMR
jgi:hypothetical protein